MAYTALIQHLPIGGDSSNWKVDSAGWGGKYDSLKCWGDSLTGAMGDWLEGCDTTGGKHCDNIFISARMALIRNKRNEGVLREPCGIPC